MAEENSPNCVKTMKLLGDFWILRIIDALSRSGKRFCEIQRDLDDVSPVTLTNRLKKLEEAQLIIRKEDVSSVAVEYELSDLGKSALPVIKALNSFSDKAKTVLV